MAAEPATPDSGPRRHAVRLTPLYVPKSSDVLADDLRERILRGDFPEDTALPPERELVKQTQMSRATVREALRRLRPDVFTKGGDRVDAPTIPEWDICQELGIEVVTGVGADKQWSSSWFLDAWSQATR